MAKKIHEMKEQWEKETLTPVIKKYPERKETFTSTSDIHIPRAALPEERDFSKDVGFPGQFPFTLES